MSAFGLWLALRSRSECRCRHCSKGSLLTQSSREPAPTVVPHQRMTAKLLPRAAEAFGGHCQTAGSPLEGQPETIDHKELG